MEPAPDLTLQGLTTRFVESSKVISDCISQNGLPKMSFDADGPAQFPVPPSIPEAHIARLQFLEAVMCWKGWSEGQLGRWRRTYEHAMTRKTLTKDRSTMTRPA